MRLLVELENGMDGRPLAWALEHPGCYAFGSDSGDAVNNMAAAFMAYQAWIERHTADSWLRDIRDVEVHLSEVWDGYNIDENYDTIGEGGYEVNAWFRHDWKPLTRVEIQRGLQLLRFSRADLLPMVQHLPEAVLDQKYPGERWSIRGVLRHIANAEHWFLDRLELANTGGRGSLPEDGFERLASVRAQLEQILPTMEGVNLVRGKDGEFWSPRKLLRRTIWHELDHIEHIGKLLAK